MHVCRKVKRSRGGMTVQLLLMLRTFLSVNQLFSVLSISDQCVVGSLCQLFSCYPALLSSANVSGCVLREMHTPNHVLFIHQERDTSAVVLPSKGLHTSPQTMIFSFSLKHARSYHLCADLKWTLGTLLLWGPNRNDLSPSCTSLFKAVFS